ncbi:DUF1360 domain-containing protein [Bacillus thermocopriae]|uniref:DUF1360 domain-containing protein n=2 Tax=Neobacillus thermocopriae TaxID=1215031 RepID=A0A6B3TR93_9BACI|nr:DUF1360 domain-containing protein [Neobacillus thermocopriae]MED3623140.1 DUF1360 domain-containing protein [Neobacillus thermocopriae]MED3715035.1 DUF1360 domain-containing protein [Neobacillus thermocopriae]NEX78890.1 DUF1360 domain-containing protein [Neobacillus thermocopriae]
MNITFMNLLILSLASFRLTRLIVFDKITEFLRKPFFDEVIEENSGDIEIYYTPKQSGWKRFVGELLSCYWCTGIWSTVGIVGMYYLSPVFTPVILILAIAGAASILETIIQFLLEK